MNRAMKKLLTLFIFTTILLTGQNLEEYYRDIEAGKLKSVRNAVEELRDNYPDNPEVLFLSTVVEDDAEKSVRIYNRIINQYPDSQTALKATVELIKYNYTTGLYHKTVEMAKEFITDHSDSELTKDVVPLLFCSLKAINRTDLIDFYKNKLGNSYPELQPYLKDSEYLSLYTISEGQRKSRPGPQNSEQFAIQIGVFSNPDNARSLMEELQSQGYKSYLQEKQSNQKFQAVKLGPYPSRARAKQIGMEIERKLNLNYIIVKP